LGHGRFRFPVRDDVNCSAGGDEVYERERRKETKVVSQVRGKQIKKQCEEEEEGEGRV